ncbi:unnamed protein product [Miscanthus lutarioriparius]|uniref:X8 domain-containing protein n=1 Tax=Miscanthus lutarioriparius TaxID=422564 RepID=A0A811SLG1_9POAL|nr:unnamed protein product [Miscanthus lutarioriparius]
MALAHFLGVALPLLLLLGAAEAGGEVGVNYGRVANDLPDPASVVQLLKQNGITMELAAAASDPSYALRWARSNVAAYHPATRIHGVAVGNEVFDSRPDLNADLVRAMANVHDALAQLGLADAVEVSTPVAFSVVTDSYPPSAGRFRDDVAQSVMKPMLGFLQRTGSYLTINIYPYLAYAEHPDQISLDYALGNSNPEVRVDDDDTAGLTLDDDDGCGVTLKAHVGETGHPSGGRPKPGRRPPRGGRRHLMAGDDGYPVASVANAHAYVNNVINRVLSGNTGTPHRPDADMDVYIFALFNENQKGDGPDDIEQNFGLFYPNEQNVYEFDFHHGGGGGGGGGGGAKASWRLWTTRAATVPTAAPSSPAGRASSRTPRPPTPRTRSTTTTSARVGQAGRATSPALLPLSTRNQPAALDYACGHGADCSAIQPGATCFEPNTKAAHASHAFNSYYQRNGRASDTCDFAGAASVVHQAPKIGNCMLPSRA